MCTRFALLQKDFQAVLERLGVAVPPGFASRYNLPPGTALPAVRVDPAKGERTLASLRWGLVPSWAKSERDGPLLANARAETITTKPSFRSAYRHRRCVIPASGFYEWTKRGDLRLPWYIQRQNGRPFCFAGLWESWHPPGVEPLETCALVTTAANAEMRPIHDRMPVSLNPAQAETWLDPSRNQADLEPLILPAPDGTFAATPVSPRMNNVRHEGPDCIVPCAHDQPGDEPELPLGSN